MGMCLVQLLRNWLSAIVETIDAGARILNLSAALVQPSAKGEGELQSALDYGATSRYRCRGSG
jgi:hypothetical protein